MAAGPGFRRRQQAGPALGSTKTFDAIRDRANHDDFLTVSRRLARPPGLACLA